jgi:acyl carrier protein
MKNIHTSAIKDTITAFIKENFIAGPGREEINPDESLLDSGILNSTGILELILFIESEYSITIEDEELTTENLDSINNLLKLLKQKGIN